MIILMNGGGVLRISSERPDVTRSDTDFNTNYIQITNTLPTQIVGLQSNLLDLI